jgi:hypothetical protein
MPTTALAHSGSGETYVAQLAALNDSGASGTAEVTLEGDQLTVMVHASGVLADQPHAQHIHYPMEMEGEASVEGSCPSGDVDEDGDGLLSTTEGHPFYGDIVVSLTTEGDVSPDSGLAVERFSSAPGGEVMYERTFTVPEGFDAAGDLSESVIVVHGIDPNGNGEYDMEGAGASDLDESLPAEATHPALCGALSPASADGVPTGLGGTQGLGNSALLLGGAGSIAAAAALVLYARHRSSEA